MTDRIKFGVAEGLNSQQLNVISERYGKKLPEFLIKFLVQYSGSIPKINGHSCIVKIIVSQDFIDRKQIEQIEGYEDLLIHLSNLNYLQEYADLFNITEGYVNAEFLFPICILPNGAIYVATEGPHIGKVYAADSGDFGIIYHSESIDSFFSKLEEDV